MSLILFLVLLVLFRRRVDADLLDSADALCSDERAASGDRMVVSYVLFGRKPAFVDGIEPNAAAIREHYGDEWQMRVYVDHGSSDPLRARFAEMRARHANLRFCDVRRLPRLSRDVRVQEVEAMMWRFVPLADATVDVFVSRDLDSLVTPRETAAVREWLTEDAQFDYHSMHDHPFHRIVRFYSDATHRHSPIGRKCLVECGERE